MANDHTHEWSEVGNGSSALRKGDYQHMCRPVCEAHMELLLLQMECSDIIEEITENGMDLVDLIQSKRSRSKRG